MTKILAIYFTACMIFYAYFCEQSGHRDFMIIINLCGVALAFVQQLAIEYLKYLSHQQEEIATKLAVFETLTEQHEADIRRLKAEKATIMNYPDENQENPNDPD